MRSVPKFESRRPRGRISFSYAALMALTAFFIINIALRYRRIYARKEYRKKTRFVVKSKKFDEVPHGTKSEFTTSEDPRMATVAQLSKSPAYLVETETMSMQLRDQIHKRIVPVRNDPRFKSLKILPKKETGKQGFGTGTNKGTFSKPVSKNRTRNSWTSSPSRDSVKFKVNSTELGDLKLQVEGKDSEDESNDGTDKSLGTGFVVRNQTNNIPRSLEKRVEYLFKFENVTIDSISKNHEDPEGMKGSILRLQDAYISRYVPWHAETLRNVKRGEIRGDEVRVLLVQGKEGIGDRIRAIIHAYFLAVLSERLLLIDWEMPFPLDSAFSSNFTHDKKYFGMGTDEEYHNLRDFGSSARHTDISSLLDDKKWVMLRKETRPNLDYMLHYMIYYHPNITALRLTSKLDPVPQEADFYPLIFRTLFRATPELRARVVQFLRSREMDSPFVGIHVRLGWDTGEADITKRFATNMSLEEIANCTSDIALQMARARKINPARFFLATDTTEVRNEIRKAIIRKTNGMGKVSFGSWKIAHIRHLQPLLKEDFDMFLNMFADLLLLSQADSLVSMKSGFPNIARWMGAINFHNVFECALSE